MTIEQVDRVMEATGADYATVKAALIKTNGDVAAAIREIKGPSTYTSQDEETVFSSQKFATEAGEVAQKVTDVIREIWEKGNASTLVVEKDGRKIINLPLTATALGLIIAPMVSLFGLGVAFLTDYHIYIVLKDGKTVDVGQEALARFDQFQHKND